MAASGKTNSSLNPSTAQHPISNIAAQQSQDETITMAPPKETISEIPAPTLSSDEQPSGKKSTRFKLTILSLCVVTIAGSMDAVIVAACLSAIADDLGGDSVESFWIGTSFLLTQTVTIPIYGTLSDIFGRKWLILSAVAVFLLGSILCARAESMEWLVAARVVCFVRCLGVGEEFGKMLIDGNRCKVLGRGER
jgi:hypothetical protein